MPSRERIPPRVKKAIHNSLVRYLLSVADGMYAFDTRFNVSDATIAKDHGVSIWSVRHQRKQFFGPLVNEKTGNNSPLAQAWERIKALEQDLDTIRSELNEVREAQKRMRNMASIVDITPNSI